MVDDVIKLGKLDFEKRGISLIIYNSAIKNL